MKNLTIITVLVICLGIGFSQKHHSNVGNPPVIKQQSLSKSHVPPVMRQAIVTWYNGRRTKPSKYIGVAHRTLPIGTLVEFRRNGITHTAIVNDRGPWGVKHIHGKRVYLYEFDVSLKLAKLLGIVRIGVATVEYKIIQSAHKK